MKKTLILIGAVTLIFGVGFYFFFKASSKEISFTSPISELKPKPLEKYTFDNLSKGTSENSQIVLEDDKLFYFTVNGKKITGQINTPSGKAPKNGWPIILMLRGYVDPQNYQTGTGTHRAAEVFAKNGFITIAPDFLGYGGSDDPDDSSITARLARPYNLLVLLNSLESLKTADSSRIGIWGHSNGGQIALSVLEITSKQYPTTLWAPVSKPFPYSILYYTDEYDDRGKALRKAIAMFEEDYDVDKYSIHNYYNQIQAKIQVHQGTIDDAVPLEWSQELFDTLEDLEKDIKLYIYQGADHNMRPSWNTVVNRDVTFFKKELK